MNMKDVNIKDRIVMVKKGSIIGTTDENGDIVEYEIMTDLFMQVKYTEKAKVKLNRVVRYNKPQPSKPNLTIIK